MNEPLKKIKLEDMAEDNELFYQGAALVTKMARRNSLGGKEDWIVKLKGLTKIWGD